MKKFISLTLAVCLLLALSAGCGNQQNDETTQPATQQATQQTTTSGVSLDYKSVGTDFPFDEYVKQEKAKWYLGHEANLTWYYSANFHNSTKPASEYPSLKTVVDITGVNWTGMVPTGDANEKMNLMMATNDIPDLITLTFGDIKGQELIDGGFVSCIEDLAKQYEPDFWNNFLADDYKAINRRSDGKMWSVSGVTKQQWQLDSKDGLAGFGYNVRKDIWLEMGSPSIATPDDLYNTLKQFKAKYPTLNGKTSIGISGYGGVNSILMTMGYSFGLDAYWNTYQTGTYVDEAAGTCTLRFFNPNYPDFIAYLNKLYREGLIDPELFIKTDTQKNIEDLSTCTFMMPYVYWAEDPANSALNAKNPDSHFICIPPMSATGKNYKAASTSSRLGEYDTYVGKNCKDPAAAMRLIAYGLSPFGSMQLLRGNPGQQWISKDGVYEFTDEVNNAYKTDSAAYNEKNGLWDHWGLMYFAMPQKFTGDPDRKDYDIANTQPYAYDVTNTSYNMVPVTTSEAGIALTNITNICTEAQTAAITAKTAEKSAEIVKKLLDDIKKVKDYDKLESFMTEQYKKNMEQFGASKY